MTKKTLNSINSSASKVASLRFEKDRNLASYFAHSLTLQPQALALTNSSVSMSYERLDLLSNFVAGFLVSKGVKKGDFVGLLMSRSIDAVVAMLGVLKCGAAYVPLDPTHAPEQLAYIVADVPLKTTLYSQFYAELSKEILKADAGAVSIEETLASETHFATPKAEATGDDPAYIMYTSGTTGQPKGVIVPQRAIAAYVLGLPVTQLTPSDVVLHTATIACDGSSFEIWGGLLTGASVAIVEIAKPSLEDISNAMKNNSVTAILWYAGLHHLMIDHKLDAFATVRLNMAGGDVMSPKHAQRLLTAFPEINLCNVYGPTETAIDSMWFQVKLGHSTDTPIPIGQPFANEDAFVVDENNKPLKSGKTGQLVISGNGVALGYYKQPSISKKVFISDPRKGRSGKVYLTGDLACQNADGMYEFLGRVDRQIKLSGRRIELDSVEHVLRSQRGVSEAAVFMVTEHNGDKRMAAVIKPEADVSDENLFIQSVLDGAKVVLHPAELPNKNVLRTNLPLTSAGKIDRTALAAEFQVDHDSDIPRPPKTNSEMRDKISAIWNDILDCGPLGDQDSFFDAGGTSLQLFDAHVQLEAVLKQPLGITLLFETPRLGDLAGKLEEITRDTPKSLRDNERFGAPKNVQGDIAIVGLAGRFPKAKSVADFWEKICEGEDLISRFDPTEMEDSLSPDERAKSNYIAARPILDDVDMFDAKFFGVLPKEAALMDPQARIFLEVSANALNDAGIDPQRTQHAIGVFAGTSMSTYMLSNIMADRATLDDFTSQFQIGNYAVLTGNVADSLSTRVAYKLNLKGPAITMGTACSTSLTAIAQACVSLRSGQSDVALAGGVSITFPQKRGYQCQEGGMASEDGICRPFDANANGTVFGHGAGVVVLKRLDDALADGDTIYASIRGVGLNNDGNDKISYTAPSVNGQADAIRMAHSDADVSAETISYVECHGTATPLGDPIEIRGLSLAFGPQERESCAVGSVKGNIGHLDAASGVMSVIKTALMLHHKQIPPVANFTSPNPNINFADSPFYVPKVLTDWVSDTPRRAGISSFGVGGTNAHLVLEEGPDITEHALPQTSPQVLVLSAKTSESLNEMAQELAEKLTKPDSPELSDIAFTLQEGRTAYGMRSAIAAFDKSSAIKALLAAPAVKKSTPETAPPVIFMFPGQGSQYPGMAGGLYQSQPEFRRWIDTGTDILEPLLKLNINEILCLSDVTDEAHARALRDTRLTQPALYLTQYANARLWQSRGISPDAMIGHSVGEFAAAAIAGVMSFENGLEMIAKRGQLMQDQPEGSMLSVRAPISDITPYLNDSVDVAGLNAPKLQVLSGPDDAIADLEARLTDTGIACSRLHTSHAFHSKMMDPVTEQLKSAFGTYSFNQPEIPYVSCVTGDWITNKQATDPAYWASQARATVNFQAAIQTANKMMSPVMLEVGAGRTLSAFTAQTLERGSYGGVFQSLTDHTRTEDDEITMATAFANLWTAGVPVDWGLLGPRGNRRVSLPGYPYQRKRHWIEPPESVAQSAMPNSATATTQISVAHTETEFAMSDTLTDQTKNRTERFTSELIALLTDLSGEDLDANDIEAPFLELGFDSLFLGQVSQALQRDYGVELTFRSLLTEYPTIAALAEKLDQTVPAEAIQTSVEEAAQVIETANTPLPPPASVNTNAPHDIATLIQNQMQTMQAVFAEQLRQLNGAQSTPAPAAKRVSVTAKPTVEQTERSEFKAGRATSVSNTELNDTQVDFARELAKKYSAKFPKSKALTDKYRDVHADPRSAGGFNTVWKEMTFPVVSDRSKGAYLWDIDGNKFIDLVNGFGQTAFGHAPEFVSNAIQSQLERGYAIGPQSEIAGQVAERFAKMVQHERVMFSNTGSEAVMSAMRLARAVTGRDKIVVFSNDYHGQFDEVLIKGKSRGGTPAALPIASGIPRSGLVNMVVLEYGASASLEWIRDNQSEVAGVLIEPIQSRHPEVQPIEFVRELRGMTREIDAALIFDEVVTGFRVHPRGMQGEWDIQADMATYGKVVGGGMPVGILAGCSKYMDALDGGSWTYGDDSKPEVAPTFVAGTFVRHPLVLAAVDATLDHLEKHGDELWSETAKRTVNLRNKMNDILNRHGLPALVVGHSSWIVINVTAHDPRATLLFALMRLEGIHMLDGFCGFLTTQHQEAEIKVILAAFEKAVKLLQENGILQADEQQFEPQKPITSSVPLTESQSEIWMASQLGDTASCCFNEGVIIQLGGPLDLDALSYSLDQIVARHDALRTVFDKSGGTFRILDPFQIDLEVIDGQTNDNVIDEIATYEANTPFDLSNGTPLFRANLVKSEPEKHVLILNTHHIICDGWSYNILFEELAKIYQAQTTGLPIDLAQPMSFANYASQQSARSTSPKTQAFWAETFEEIPELPELPTDFPRPFKKSFEASSVTTFIDAQLMIAVRKAGAKQGCTLFSTLFGAFQITLGKLANSTDVVIGVPTSGQSMLENQNMVGHCVNFLPIRSAFEANDSLSDHLKRTSGAILNAFDHQDYTLGSLVRDIDPPRSLNRMPITEIQFNLEKVPEELDMGDIEIRMFPNEKAASNFDLYLNIIESRNGLRMDATYNSDVFLPETIERWLSHFQQVLNEFVQNHSGLISKIQFSAANKNDNKTTSIASNYDEFDQHAMIQDLIATAVSRYPDAVSLDDGTKKLTYQFLAQQSDALAAYIQQQVPGNGAIIAVSMNRSVELVVAMLAILKAGHAYLPLDPKQPNSRLRLIAEAGQITAVVADEPSASEFARGLDITTINPSRAPELGIPAPSVTDPESAAYVIFTSGTTGTPKGVEISHRSVVNFLTSMAKKPGISASDSLLSVTTVMFDIAVLELLLPLTVGARVVIAKNAEILDGFALVDRLSKGDITIVQATPTLWEMLLHAGYTPRSTIKQLAGGEPLPVDLVQKLLSQGAELWNMYGPTETTIWSSTEKVEANAPVTVGEPIANTTLVILDSQNNVAPIGVTGELNIGGKGLANGYFGQPDLTKEAFRKVEINGDEQLLYRTGDLAKLRSDGKFEVLGRIDSQVKLRGFRIELGEIESKLREIKGVHKVAVDLKTRTNGDRQLVAFIVASQGHELDISELRLQLSNLLPDYMVPQTYVMLTTLPQTANGKLDRKSLPDPDASAEPSPLRPQKSEMGNTESLIATIWAEVLGRDDFGKTETIYALGVDSLKVFRIAARLMEAGLDLQARDLLKHPTIETLARFSDERAKDEKKVTRPALRDFRRGAGRLGRGRS